MKMPGLVELERTREDLSLALSHLDTLALETSRLQGQQGPPAQETQLLRERVALLQESNEHLADRNDQVTNSFQKVREEKERLKGDVEELSKLSNKLQGDIQQVTEEKLLLTSIVRNTQGENEMLSKVMQKISTDYEELKKSFEKQKCPKDDKIQALRSTARALESENVLLHEEKTMILRENSNTRAALEAKIQRLEARDQQQRAALEAGEVATREMGEKLRRKEEEASTVARQLSKAEQEITTMKKKKK